MTLRLIVNADDYGRTSEISRGIRQAHRDGIVTSTTCMMNFPNIVDDLALARQETPHLGLGVHLVLTAGKPLSSTSNTAALTASDGNFLKLVEFTDGVGTINVDAVQAEWRAQIERFVHLTGSAPTHLDSHHHSSYFSEGLFRAMLELAREYKCAIRQPMARVESNELTGLPPQHHAAIREYAPRLLAEFGPPAPDGFYASFYDQRATKDEILHIINHLPENGVYELMCHPGYADPALIASSVYARQREGELTILTDEDVQQAINGRGIRLVSFAAL